MRQSIDMRRQRIVELVQSHGDLRTGDLADLFEVSVMTVRRDIDALVSQKLVVRRHGRVQAVDAAPETGGSSLADVLVVIPERHPILRDAASSAITQLRSLGVHASVRAVPAEAGAQNRMLDDLSQDESCDGLIIAPRWFSRREEIEHRPLLARLGRPAVLLERVPEESSELVSVDSVVSDHSFGVRLALEHLVDRGHRRVVLATRYDSPTARSVAESFPRVAGTLDALERWERVLSAPDAVPERAMLEGSPAHCQAGGAEVLPLRQPDFSDPQWVLKLLRAGGFTGMIVHSDVNALALAQQLEACGVRIPEDCAIVAYDDVVAGHGAIPLTAVAPPKVNIGQAAATLIVERMRAEATGYHWSTRRVQLLPELVQRAST